MFRQPGEGVGGSFNTLGPLLLLPTIKNVILSSLCLSKFYYSSTRAQPSLPGRLERVGSVPHPSSDIDGASPGSG